VPPRRWRATAVASMRCQAAVLRGSQPQPLRPSMGAPLQAAPWLSRVRRTNETRRQKRHTPQGRFRPRPGRMILDAENDPIARHISPKTPEQGLPPISRGDDPAGSIPGPRNSHTRPDAPAAGRRRPHAARPECSQPGPPRRGGISLDSISRAICWSHSSARAARSRKCETSASSSLMRFSVARNSPASRPA
jgi:hypothetical protein